MRDQTHAIVKGYLEDDYLSEEGEISSLRENGNESADYYVWYHYD